jgi:hypothetical protein
MKTTEGEMTMDAAKFEADLRAKIAEEVRADGAALEAGRTGSSDWVWRVIGPSLMRVYDHIAELIEKGPEDEPRR